MSKPLNIVILGLSITSAWGNGHATVYRALVRALVRLGHHVTFLERDTTWYAANRDLPHPPFGSTHLYESVEDLKDRFADIVRHADVAIVGSYVPDGIEVGQWVVETASGVTGFYDIDTPITVARLEDNTCEYITPGLVSQYDLYLSFTGGPLLQRLEQEFGSPRARPLYCCFNPDLYYPEAFEPTWDLGYMGTYSEDRQPGLQHLMLEPARRWRTGRYVVAGPQYPENIDWPTNVERIERLPPAERRSFYNRQRFTLNLTRSAMVQAGYSPSVRLFEAAACGTAIITDYWEGLDQFFEIGRDILVARDPQDTLRYLCEISEEQRVAIGLRAREKMLTGHTAAHRAAELQRYVLEAPHRRRPQRVRPSQSVQQKQPDAGEAAELHREMMDLGPWLQNLHLPDGEQTAPDLPTGEEAAQQWEQLAAHLPEDLRGWSALDIGCSAGFFSVELAKRGARVLSIDQDAHCVEQSRWVAKQFGFEDRIRCERMQVYDLARLNRRFDLVLFMGVFHHLRYPLLGLDLVAEKVSRMVAFQTMTLPGHATAQPANTEVSDGDAMTNPDWPKMAFIEYRMRGDPTNWWAPNGSAVEAMLRSAGLNVTQRVDSQLYLCQPDPASSSPMRTWDRVELLAATGRPWQHLLMPELVM